MTWAPGENPERECCLKPNKMLSVIKKKNRNVPVSSPSSHMTPKLLVFEVFRVTSVNNLLLAGCFSVRAEDKQWRDINFDRRTASSQGVCMF